MTRLHAAAVTAALLSACAAPTPDRSPTPERVTAAEPAAAGLAATTDAEPGPDTDAAHREDLAITSLGETEARLLLAELFREAGYRILYDVELTESGTLVAVDGFDPDKRVGYEYVAPPEHQTATAADALKSASGVRLLVIGPTTRDKLTEAARAFIKAQADAE